MGDLLIEFVRGLLGGQQKLEPEQLRKIVIVTFEDDEPVECCLGLSGIQALRQLTLMAALKPSQPSDMKLLCQSLSVEAELCWMLLNGLKMSTEGSHESTNPMVEVIKTSLSDTLFSEEPVSWRDNTRPADLRPTLERLTAELVEEVERRGYSMNRTVPLPEAPAVSMRGLPETEASSKASAPSRRTWFRGIFGRSI